MNPNRLALAVIACLGLALVPTLLHSYADVKAEDPYTTAAIATRLAGLSSQPTVRRAGWAKTTFASDDWIERRYRKADGSDLLLFVSRSYDLKRLYHHPELAIAYGSDVRHEGTTRLAGMKDVPVHVLRGEAGHGTGLAVYSLLYANEFVDHPYTFHLQIAWQLLFAARKPMTLFFAHDAAARPDTSLDDAPAVRLLQEAIRSFLSNPRRSRSE